MAAGARKGAPAAIAVSTLSFTLPAYAKINRTLRIIGRRPDGFHEIRTVFQTITLSDSLTFSALAEGSLELACDAPGVPCDESNLVLRAAKALRERYAIRPGARIELEKRIPTQAGLGGGSADAAAALLGLAHLWEIQVSKNELVELGARLGADVPFFLTGGTALGKGLGTEITPLHDAPPEHLLIITPNAKVGTKEAYEALNAPALTKAEAVAILPISRERAAEARALLKDWRNDFEPAIFQLQPEIARARAALLRGGAQRALMSGSGSSVFGLFESDEELERAGARLRCEEGWRVFACATLARGEYERAFGAAWRL